MTDDELNNALDGIDESVSALRESQLDEQDVDNLLVQQGINEDHYSSMGDLANENAIDDVDDIN